MTKHKSVVLSVTNSVIAAIRMTKFFAGELIYQRENDISPDSDRDAEDFQKTCKIVGELDIRRIDVATLPIRGKDRRKFVVKLALGRRVEVIEENLVTGTIVLERYPGSEEEEYRDASWEPVSGSAIIRFADGTTEETLESEFWDVLSVFPTL